MNARNTPPQYNGRYMVCALILGEEWVCKATVIAPVSPDGPVRKFAEEGHSNPAHQAGFYFCARSRHGCFRQEMAEGMKHRDRDSSRRLSPDRSHACCNIVGGSHGHAVRKRALGCINTAVGINGERALPRIAAAADLKIRPRALASHLRLLFWRHAPAYPSQKPANLPSWRVILIRGLRTFTNAR